MFTTQYVTPANMGQQVIAVKANGGSVVIEKQVGTDWVVTDTLSADGGYRMDLGRSPVRFTPSGGAAYEVVA